MSRNSSPSRDRCRDRFDGVLHQPLFRAPDYAKLYGTMFGIFALGVGIGPALSGASFDRFQSYVPAFVVFEIMLAVSCLIFLRLGPYPFPALAQAVSGDAEKMPA